MTQIVDADVLLKCPRTEHTINGKACYGVYEGKFVGCIHFKGFLQNMDRDSYICCNWRKVGREA